MSALTLCKTCNREVAKSAKVCPQCGARLKPRLISQLLVVIGVLVVIALVFGPSGKEKRETALKRLDESASAQAKKTDGSASLQTVAIAPTGELAEMFKLMSPYTNVQRENKFEELKGKTVAWTLKVYEVRKDGDVYEVQTAGDGEVSTFVEITPRDDADTQLLLKLKTGDAISVRGEIAKVRMRHLVLQPAVLERSAPEQAKAAAAPTHPTEPVATAVATTSNSAVGNIDQTEQQKSATLPPERSKEEINADLLKAAKATVTVYRSSGISGLIGEIQDCYKKSTNKYYCIYLDVAAHSIDQSVVAANPRFPKTPYFADEQFGQRVGGVLVRAQITLEQANDYLATITSALNKLVLEQMDSDNVKSENKVEATPENAQKASSPALTKHRDQIATLGMRSDFLKSMVYVNYLGINAPVTTLENWIASVMERKGFQKVTPVEYFEGRYKGVTVKFANNPSIGFLFRSDPPDLYLSHVVEGDRVNELDSPGKQSQGALLFSQMTSEPKE
jgi:uncharacterized OB-fold protein